MTDDIESRLKELQPRAPGADLDQRIHVVLSRLSNEDLEQHLRRLPLRQPTRFAMRPLSAPQPSIIRMWPVAAAAALVLAAVTMALLSQSQEAQPVELPELVVAPEPRPSISDIPHENLFVPVPVLNSTTIGPVITGPDAAYRKFEQVGFTRRQSIDTRTGTAVHIFQPINRRGYLRYAIH